MTIQDIFLRAHTVAACRKERKGKKRKIQKWPEQVLVFDTETTTDTEQDLLFGVYRLCERNGDEYLCAEEGMFYADDLDADQLEVLKRYARSEIAGSEINVFPPKLKLALYSRSMFLKKVFWKAVQRGSLIVAFNAPFDLSRLAVDWGRASDGGWSLMLSQWLNPKTGQLEEDTFRPRIVVKSLNSKTAFVSLRFPRPHKQLWPIGRFLDLRTLGWALHNRSYSLKKACKKFNATAQKKNHTPSGRVTKEDVDYARQDGKCTTALLNAMKREFDRHPIDLLPEKTYSPATIAKGYLEAMGIIPPLQKFKIPEKIQGIAMQAYYGGRAECRVRCTEVPVVPVDFVSQYATVCSLLGNSDLLTAKRLSFDDATNEVRELVKSMTLDKAFDAERWRQFKFFALVGPEKDIFPVRSVYDGRTQNIGSNYLTSQEPIWFAGPDVMAAVLETGKAPHIEKAIRIVPHGKQAGLRPTNLRGMVEIDPRKEDFFRRVVEERKKFPKDDPMEYFLKIFASSGSYGLFVEVNQKDLDESTAVGVFSGEHSHEESSKEIEEAGKWYSPILASLIAAGGRLMLAMLERCVADAKGSYLFCDTDSLCIISSRESEPLHIAGAEGLRTLSWTEVQSIIDKFDRLNPYDRRYVSGSILSLVKANHVDSDSTKPRRQLYGYSVSSKRYVIYEKSAHGDIKVIEPKAHGLGYLAAPKEEKEGEEGNWIAEAWDWLLRCELGLECTAPTWLDIPAMMPIVISTPNILQRLEPRPFSFLLIPQVDSQGGLPANVDASHFTLVTSYTSNRSDWLNSECVNIFDGEIYRLALEQTAKLDKVIPRTYGHVLYLYRKHPEAKSLAPDGTACTCETRGLLQRCSVVAASRRYVGKETDRRWEQGEDLSLLEFTSFEYQQSKQVVAGDDIKEDILKTGIRRLERRTGVSHHTLDKILQGKPVRRKTLVKIIKQLSCEGPIDEKVVCINTIELC
jgi:hypothetical protein